MQESGGAGRRPAGGEGVPGLSPVRAFFLLGAVATVVPLTILATRPDAAPSAPPATSSPDFSLTDAEAIAEFERLNAIRIAAYKARDITLLSEALATTSPLLARGEKEIRTLLDDGVVIKSSFITKSVRIIENAPTQVVVRQTEVDRPKIVTEDGREVTSRGGAQERVIEWTLRLENYVWKIYDSHLIESRRLGN
ncbi:MAG: hypothetical protein M3217_08135 [Actinomycetota bacterium]|nr:hypothetical protein [Actinomycetota bacterium]